MTERFMQQVFVNEDGQFGNPSSVIIDEQQELSTQQRIELTTTIGHDETIFVNDIDHAEVSIYHSYGEVSFAGNALVGAGWQLAKLNGLSKFTIHSRDTDIETWRDKDLSWIRAKVDENMLSWNHEQLENASAVEKILLEDTAVWNHKMVWAWSDESEGIVRARTFANDLGISEVQGNGSGSMQLAVKLQRSLQIIHGDGSIIYVKPMPSGFAELGGRVITIGAES